MMIKDKVEQSRERCSAPLHLGVVAIEKGAFLSPSTTVTNFTFTLLMGVVFRGIVMLYMGTGGWYEMEA